ncbi:hypothetical protein HDV01_001641 [Terramyces sp. JEL0728]|nr:hypothetical protein HDV01_001641 [Terramyces sp. JEL0728]
MSDFEEVKLAGALQVPYSIQMDTVRNSLAVMSRPLFVSLRYQVHTFAGLPRDEVRNGKCVLTGPAGAGKSLLLYLCALDCFKSGNWLVVYISNTSTFYQKEDSVCAIALLQSLLDSNQSLFERHADKKKLQRIRTLAENALNQRKDEKEALTMIFQTCLFDCDVPVFIGIDQWNCLQKDTGIQQPLLEKLFGHFSYFNLKWGYAMLAVSSSFDIQQSQMFSDMDASLAGRYVNLYTTEEWSTVVMHYRTSNFIPNSFILPDTNLFELTGRVPRLLMMVKNEYLNNGNSLSAHNQKLIQGKNVKYFAQRITRILERHREKEILQFAALAVTNQFEFRPLPDRWVDSGLFEVLDDEKVTPIAPTVLDALYSTISDQLDSIIRVLASTDARGYAFQMFIQLGFAKKQSQFKFRGCRLDSTTSDLDFTILVAKKIDQICPKLNESIPAYEDNTMIVCYGPTHPVVDVVIYSGGFINFVSISVSSYSIHATGAHDIFKCLVGNTKFSVLEYYCLASPYSVSKKFENSTRWTASLKEHVRFIYITTDQTKHNKSTLGKSGASEVFRVNGDALQVFGHAFKYFIQ